jgi:hypothetical protein
LRHLSGPRLLRRRGLQQVRRSDRGQLLLAAPMHSAHVPSGRRQLRSRQRRMRWGSRLRFVHGPGFLRRRWNQRVWTPDGARWRRGALRSPNLHGPEHPVRTRRGWLRLVHFLRVVSDDAVLRRRRGAEPVRQRHHVRRRDVRAARLRVRIGGRRMRRSARLRWMRYDIALHRREMPRTRARAGRRSDVRSADVCAVTALLRPRGGRLRRHGRQMQRGGPARAMRLRAYVPGGHPLLLAAHVRGPGHRMRSGWRWMRQRPLLRDVLPAPGLRRRRAEQVRIRPVATAGCRSHSRTIRRSAGPEVTRS